MKSDRLPITEVELDRILSGPIGNGLIVYKHADYNFTLTRVHVDKKGKVTLPYGTHLPGTEATTGD